jgi:hypothetical protein
MKVDLDDLIGFGSFPEVGVWNLEGKRVSANYLGDVPVKGVVVESRVGFAGQISHMIDVEEAFEIPVVAISREVGGSVIVGQECITDVLE